jgi:hypothetical protein
MYDMIWFLFPIFESTILETCNKEILKHVFRIIYIVERNFSCRTVFQLLDPILDIHWSPVDKAARFLYSISLSTFPFPSVTLLRHRPRTFLWIRNRILRINIHARHLHFMTTYPDSLCTARAWRRMVWNELQQPRQFGSHPSQFWVSGIRPRGVLGREYIWIDSISVQTSNSLVHGDTRCRLG